MHTEIRPLTQIEIENGLRKLGLFRGASVEVHSSLSSFGQIEGGANTIIDALMNIVGNQGALIMSAYPISKPLPLSKTERERGILAKVRIFDETYDGPTGMGRIADEFRKRPGTITGRGIHRVCAWGHNAGRHSMGYDYLLEVNGLVLMLGVGIDRCSSMHLAEKNGLPQEITKYHEVPEDIRKEYAVNIHIAYGHTPEDGWENIWNIAQQKGLIRTQFIGKAKCYLFEARALIDIYESALRADPLGLFGMVDSSVKCNSDHLP